jgi:hypothetical protein
LTGTRVASTKRQKPTESPSVPHGEFALRPLPADVGAPTTYISVVGDDVGMEAIYRRPLVGSWPRPKAVVRSKILRISPTNAL